MSYKIAGIDVHKKVLAVVVSDVEIESEYQFERRMFNSNPEQLRSLAAWLVEQEAEEVVMESTAQYWKPVLGSTGKILEADPREAGRSQTAVWNVTSCAGAVQSRAARTKEGFRRCRTAGETISSPRIELELLARVGAPLLERGNPHQYRFGRGFNIQ